MNDVILKKLVIDVPSAMKVQQYLPAQKTLRSFGFVQFRRSGKTVFYSVAQQKVNDIFSSAADFMLNQQQGA